MSHAVKIDCIISWKIGTFTMKMKVVCCKWNKSSYFFPKKRRGRERESDSDDFLKSMTRSMGDIYNYNNILMR